MRSSKKRSIKFQSCSKKKVEVEEISTDKDSSCEDEIEFEVIYNIMRQFLSRNVSKYGLDIDFLSWAYR